MENWHLISPDFRVWGSSNIFFAAKSRANFDAFTTSSNSFCPSYYFFWRHEKKSTHSLFHFIRFWAQPSVIFITLCFHDIQQFQSGTLLLAITESNNVKNNVFFFSGGFIHFRPCTERMWLVCLMSNLNDSKIWQDIVVVAIFVGKRKFGEQ